MLPLTAALDNVTVLIIRCTVNIAGRASSVLPCYVIAKVCTVHVEITGQFADRLSDDFVTSDKSVYNNAL